MNFVTATISDKGGRPNNQDAFSWGRLEGREGGYWIVADGLGGHEGGEVAASLACERIQEWLRNESGDSFQDCLEPAIESAHMAITEAQEQTTEKADMRTTIVLLSILDGKAQWVHCGDSRLYFFRGSELIQQTLDDSVPQALVNLGEISPLEIRGHEDRNRFTRCLGSPGSFRCTQSLAMDVVPGDSFLLCTDGFWEDINEIEMMVDLAKATSCQDWLERMAQRHGARVSGNHDNYTAITVWIEQD